MSESKTSVNATPAIGLSTILAAIFITLKLAGIGVVATWSWVWVLSPLWIGFALFLALVLIFFMFAALVAMIRG